MANLAVARTPECNHIDYDASGTFTNVLGTHNGWPTNGVPFFIEWEVDDRCLGCVSANMKAEPLHVNFKGLDAEYIWGEGDRYGHNYCEYGDPGFLNTKVSPGSFTCQSGYGDDYCASGDELRKYMEMHILVIPADVLVPEMDFL